MSVPGELQDIQKRTQPTQGTFQSCSVLAGVSRRLAELIEASFPDKTRQRRYALTLQQTQVASACVSTCMCIYCTAAVMQGSGTK